MILYFLYAKLTSIRIQLYHMCCYYIETQELPIETSTSSSVLPPSSTIQQQDIASNIPLCKNVFPLNLKPRNYQKELAEPGIKGENYIVVAPTGSGKTLVAALVISEHLKNRRGKEQHKVIFMVRTRALAEQQQLKLEKYIQGARVELCIGAEEGTIHETLSQPYFDIIVCTAGKLAHEIKSGKVSLSTQISLVVIDECHHVNDDSLYAKVMESYLEEKHKHEGKIQLPQVIGLTASPGAGKLDKTIDHLVTLCAGMDASGGFRIVRENIQELKQHLNIPTFDLKILKPREDNDAFILIIEKEMNDIEKKVYPKLDLPHLKWSRQYQSRIQQRLGLLEYGVSDEVNFREQINIVKVLICYNQVLMMYMDLRDVDALSVLEEFDEFPKEQMDDTERDLQERILHITEKLKGLPSVKNPLLKPVELKICETFSRSKDSKGIVFVSTKKHADRMCKWISSLSDAPTLGLNPEVFTGHAQTNNLGMSTDQQKAVMRKFEKGECNLLVATSVAEEGLDIPACNLVIRFQHVSDEIGKIQTLGRARAADSEGLTILSSDSKKHIKEMRTDERCALVKECLERNLIPTGSDLITKLTKKQHELLDKAKAKLKLKEQLQQHAGEDVVLRCKRCNAFACNGSDVFISDETSDSQYIVPTERFRDKFREKPHNNPDIISANVSKKHKIHCRQCENEWGITVYFYNEDREFPVLKCKMFKFVIKGTPERVPKWSVAPFKMHPLKVWLELQAEDSQKISSDRY